MVSVEGNISIHKLKVGVRLREPKLHDLFVLQELELLQRFLEMLHLTEHLCQVLVVVHVELRVESVLGFKSLQMEDCHLADFVRTSFGLFWNIDLEIVITRGVCHLDAVLLIANTVNDLLQFRDR